MAPSSPSTQRVIIVIADIDDDDDVQENGMGGACVSFKFLQIADKRLRWPYAVRYGIRQAATTPTPTLKVRLSYADIYVSDRTGSKIGARPAVLNYDVKNCRKVGELPMK